MTFGENLKTLRNTRSISQKDLAVELGFSFQNISKWERNESLPDIGTLIEIAKFLKNFLQKGLTFFLEWVIISKRVKRRDKSSAE